MVLAMAAAALQLHPQPRSFGEVAVAVLPAQAGAPCGSGAAGSCQHSWPWTEVAAPGCFPEAE